MESKELYEVLGLQPFADGAMVDQAYWHLAKSFQTLAVTDPRARQSLDELNEAYGVLGTPRLREEYDETLRSRAPRVSHRDAKHATTTKPGFSLKALFVRKSRSEPAPYSEATVPPLVTPTAATRTTEAPAIRSSRRSTSDVEHLQASTGAMLERWRANTRLDESPTRPGVPESSPDTTLVDIFRTEQAVEDDQDPLNAVMDVLRASKDSAKATAPS